MKKDTIKYLYLSPIDSEGAIFQTQVVDWLRLYKEHDVSFDLIRVFHARELLNIKFIKHQVKITRSKYEQFVGSVFLLPEKSIFYFINALLLFFKILKYSRKADKVVVFSRYVIGNEIRIIKRLFSKKVVFYYDARGAGAEERKHTELIHRNFSLKSYKTIARVYNLNYETLNSADKVFVVSNVLKKYFIKTFAMDEKRFVLYPCLSDSKRFFYNVETRSAVRKELGIGDEKQVFIYAGGTSKWHMTEKLFEFFNELLGKIDNCYFLFLTRNTKDIEEYLEKYPEIRPHLSFFSVNNTEIYKYYNAADFGLLFRHNTIMNNVSSPTKFAEYILCGLPVIISEGVGDYSQMTVDNPLGIQISEEELNDMNEFDFNKILKSPFDRKKIAEYGNLNLSKNCIINHLVQEIKNH